MDQERRKSGAVRDLRPRSEERGACAGAGAGCKESMAGEKGKDPDSGTGRKGLEGCGEAVAWGKGKEDMEEDRIILTDEEGQEREFELLDILTYEGEEYAVLYPTEDGEDQPVHILRVTAEDLDAEEASYEGLEDPDLIQTLYHLFRKRNGL